mgnify:CR=1 FL=1
MTDYTVRGAREEDAADMIALLNPIIAAGAYTALDRPYSLDEQRAFVRQFPPRGVFQVAVESATGRVVGMQTLEPFATYTGAFDHVAVVGTFVDLALRRRGIGRLLADAAFAEARTKGYEKVFTYVRADNPGALAYYRGLGFRVVGVAERQARIAGRVVDEVIIERFL